MEVFQTHPVAKASDKPTFSFTFIHIVKNLEDNESPQYRTLAKDTPVYQVKKYK